MTGLHLLDESLARRLLIDHPNEGARLLEGLESQEQVNALLVVEAEAAAEVLRYMDRVHAAACLASWPEERRPELLATLDPGLAARLLKLLDRAKRNEVLSPCPDRVADRIRRLSKYPAGTAGAVMDPDPPAAPEDISVEAAGGLLRRRSSRTRGQLYVVSRDDVLVGVIEIEDLLHGPPEGALGTLMRPVTARLSARADSSAIASHPGWRHHHTLPVVDRNEVLVGAIDYRTLRELEEESAVRGGNPPLGLALGEMYWTVLSAIVEGVVHSMRPAGAIPKSEVHR